MQASRVIRRFILPSLALALAGVFLLLAPAADTSSAQADPVAVDDEIFGIKGLGVEFDLCANDDHSASLGHVKRNSGRYPTGGFTRANCIVTGTPDRAGTWTYDYTYSTSTNSSDVATATFHIFEDADKMEDHFRTARTYGPLDIAVPDGELASVKSFSSNCNADGTLSGDQVQQSDFSDSGATTFVFEGDWHCVQDIIPESGWTFIGKNGAKVRPVATGNDERSVFLTSRDLDDEGERPSIEELPSNVTVANLEITGYKPGRNFGAVHSYGASDWQIVNNSIHGNVGAGVDIGPEAIVSGNEIYRNAQIGVSGFGFNSNPDISLPALTNVAIVDNSVYDNGNDLPAIYRDFRYNHHEGGIKVTKATDLLVRGNLVDNNEGIGFFCDLFCDGVTATQNVFVNNFADDPLVEGDTAAAIAANIERAYSKLQRNDEEFVWEDALKTARIRPRSAGAIFYEIGRNLVVQGNVVRANIEPVPHLDAITQDDLDPYGIKRKTIRSWQDDRRFEFLGGITVAESTNVDVRDNYVNLTAADGSTATISSSIAVRNHSHLRSPGFDGSVEDETQPTEACYHKSRGELDYIPRDIVIEDNRVESDGSSFVGQPTTNGNRFLNTWGDYHGLNQADGTWLTEQDGTPIDPVDQACNNAWDATRQLDLMCNQTIADSVTFKSNTFSNVTTTWRGVPRATVNQAKWTFPKVALPDESTPATGPCPALGYLEAEDFTRAFDVDDPSARPATAPDYRDTDVDIYSFPDGRPGHAVGQTRSFEWLEYNFVATQSGEFDVFLYVASGAETPGRVVTRLYPGGAKITGGDAGVTPPSRDWWEFDDIRAGSISLAAGEEYRLRLSFNRGGQMNLDGIDIRPQS